MKIFFAGEGSDELAEWAGPRGYWPREGEPAQGGILHALARQVRGEHSTHDAVCWSAIRKFRAGDRRAPETRTVLGLALKAEESGCDALVFVRDRDGDEEREADVERGLAQALAKFGVAIVGGTANEEIEAWLLAILGDRQAEQRRDPKEHLRAKHGINARAAKLALLDGADLSKLDAAVHPSFVRWLERAREHLAP